MHSAFNKSFRRRQPCWKDLRAEWVVGRGVSLLGMYSPVYCPPKTHIDKTIDSRPIRGSGCDMTLLVGATGFEPATPCAQGKLGVVFEQLYFEQFTAIEISCGRFCGRPRGERRLDTATQRESAFATRAPREVDGSTRRRSCRSTQCIRAVGRLAERNISTPCTSRHPHHISARPRRDRDLHLLARGDQVLLQ